MIRASHAARTPFVLAAVVLACTGGALAETPGEIPKPWTYEGSMKLQEQQRQQEQQGQAPSPVSPQRGANGAAGGGGQAGAALEAARRTWQGRPALPPDRNPLLGGRWARPASTRANSSDPFAALGALAKGGLCEVLFGGGVFEFRPNTLVGMDPHGPEQELDRVDYRGDAKHVVVLPKTTVRLMEFDVETPDRINWSSQHCVLVRVGTGSSAAAAAATSARAAAATPASDAGARRGGVLSLSVSAPSPGSMKLAGRPLWVLKADAQVLLVKAGLQSTPSGSALQNWMRACRSRAPLCEQGVVALKGSSVGIATTDANGRAQTPLLPAGRYWVLSDAKVDNRQLMWNEPVDVTSGPASLTLDARNAKPVD